MLITVVAAVTCVCFNSIKHLMATETSRVKIVVIGDGDIGKSCFLTRWKDGTFRDTYCPPSIFNQYEAEISVDGRPVIADVWYIAGQEDYDRLRPLSYPQTDIFLLSFSVVHPDSLENIKAKWVSEVKHFCPKTPYALLGTKHDLRGSVERGRNETDIPVKKALRYAKDIGAVGYYEASALSGAGVEETVEFCVRTVLSVRNAPPPKSTLSRKRTHIPFSTNTNGPIRPPPPKLPPKEDAPPIIIPSSTFAADWYNMVDNSSHSDVVFKLATKTYYAHRYVLACGSDVLRQLLGVRERVRGEGLDKRLNEGKMTQERINSGQVDGLLHIEERISKEGQAVTEVTFDPNVVSEVAISRVLMFLYKGEVELNKGNEGLDETIKISELLNLPELKAVCQNALNGKKILFSVSTDRNTAVAKQLFLNKPLFSDVRFRVEGELVHAHRLVLCARCEVMAAMLSGAFQESQANEIEIPDVSLAPFLLYLEYLYTDRVGFNDSSCTSVLELANRFVMDRLTALCESYISKQVERATADSIANAEINVVDLLLVSQLHNAAQLSSWCLHFISSNYVEFESKDEFQRLSGSNLDYVQEHRWPPLSHEAAVEEYQRKYLSKELQGSSKEKGESRGAEGVEGKNSKSALSRMFKRGK